MVNLREFARKLREARISRNNNSQSGFYDSHERKQQYLGVPIKVRDAPRDVRVTFVSICPVIYGSIMRKVHEHTHNSITFMRFANFCG